MPYSFSFYSVQHCFWLRAWPDRTVEWTTQDSVSLKTTSRKNVVSHLTSSTSYILKCNICFESEPSVWCCLSHSQTKHGNKKMKVGVALLTIIRKNLIAKLLLSILLTSNYWSGDLDSWAKNASKRGHNMVLLLDWKMKLRVGHLVLLMLLSQQTSFFWMERLILITTGKLGIWYTVRVGRTCLQPRIFLRAPLSSSMSKSKS